MKILVFGATGFIGRAIVKELSSHHEVVVPIGTSGDSRVDLSDIESVRNCVHAAQPDVIVNAAGIVDPNGDVSLNVTFTRHILNAVEVAGECVKRVIVMGSAAEYGIVSELPVKEETDLLGSSPYAHSKIEEETYALSWSDLNGVPVVVARVFNPVGLGMAEKFLFTNVLRQAREYKEGRTSKIQVSRKDSRRDYIAVTDIARGIRCIIEGQPSFSVYNLGSGRSTSNIELVELVVKYVGITDKIPVIETSQEVEAKVASRADVSRMQHDFGWKAELTVSDTLKEIVSSEDA